jgi:serine-type D-Ala-D-Ala carboxypeptidase (penicillin-binding protein 5/6)
MKGSSIMKDSAMAHGMTLRTVFGVVVGALVLMSGAFAAPVVAQTAGRVSGSEVSVTAPKYQQALFVIHPDTGTVLEQVNGDGRMGPASLTKMMTLYLTFDALKQGRITLDTQVPVSEKAWRTEGSKMFIEVGKTVPVKELIQGIAVVSGNDACVAMAEQLGGTEEGFAQQMNAMAQTLGMTGSQFKNSSGLPHPEQYTTAHDMARLLTAIFRDFPEYKAFMAEQEFTYNGIRQQNRNRLLGGNVGIDASKTGHTQDSGYHLASTAVQNGERLVVVVMGTSSFAEREGATLQALRLGFTNYRRHVLFTPGQRVSTTEVPVWQGTQRMVGLTVAEPVSVFAKPDELAKLKVSVTHKTPLLAPLAADTPVGELTVTLNGQSFTHALVPQQAVPQAGFVGRFWQSLQRTLGF